MVKKSKSYNIILFVTLSILIAVSIILGVLIYHFNNLPSKDPLQECIAANHNSEIVNCIDSEKIYLLYSQEGMSGVNDYYDNILSYTENETEITIVLINKIIFLSSVNGPKDDVEKTLSALDLTLAPNFYVYKLYLALSTYYLQKQDLEKSNEYFNEAMTVNGVEDYKVGA